MMHTHTFSFPDNKWDICLCSSTKARKHPDQSKRHHMFLSIHPSAPIFSSLHHQNNIPASHSYIRLPGTTLISESLIRYINLTNSLSSFSCFKFNNLVTKYIYIYLDFYQPSINPSNHFIFCPSNRPFNPDVCPSHKLESSVGFCGIIMESRWYTHM